MTRIADDAVDRFRPLFERLAACLIELDPEGVVTRAEGDIARHFGCKSADLVGQPFRDLILRQDMGLWDLVVFRMLKGRRVGPVPIRVKKGEGLESGVELVAARLDNGAVQLGLNAYQGHLGATMAPPPQIANEEAVEATPAHFTVLAKRLQEYGETIDVGSAEALLSLVGMEPGKDASPERAAKQLWALHKLLSDTVQEVENLGQKKRQKKAVAPLPTLEEGRASEEQVRRADDNMREVANSLRSERGKILGTGGCLTIAGYDGLSEKDIVRAAGYAVRKSTAANRLHSMEKLAGTVEEQVKEAKARLKRFRTMVIQERFDIAVQPIIHLSTNAVHHHEALVRFDKEDYPGSPQEMIRFAEEIGMIQDFDVAMTMKVVSLIRRLRRIGIDFKVAVNLSGRSVQSPIFLRNFFHILEDCSDVRKNLSFELTESSRISDVFGVNRSLQRLRKLGHSVALDDFGAGASGLEYLQCLDVDVVKIDQQYVARALDDHEDRAFLHSLIDLCRTRDIDTVGEGVETEEGREMLISLGVTYAQGYLFGRPTPIKDALTARVGADKAESVTA